MKTLVVYYSRTGTTRKVAESISKELKCDIEEVYDLKNRDGVVGYLSAGKDATLKKLTEIKDVKNDPSKYDLVIMGTPIWSWTMSSAIRTYLTVNKNNFKNVAFFCTMNGSKGKTFEHMREICGKEPKALLGLTTKEVKGNYLFKVKEFVDKLK